jgi:hypothetical protein
MSKVKPLTNLEDVKGLFIGINYRGTQNELKGCENDAIAFKKYFMNKGLKEKNITLMTSNQTKKNIIDNIKALSKYSYIENNKKFIIQYSGHGTSFPDTNGDEIDGKDEGLVSGDSRIITDDEIFILLNTFHPLSKIFFIIDACHSCSILDLPYSYIHEEQEIKENNNKTQVKIIMISGCRDNQYSLDVYSNSRRQSCGALSNQLILLDFLNIPIFDLKNNLQNSLVWAKQTPCISSTFKLDNTSISDTIFT